MANPAQRTQHVAAQPRHSSVVRIIAVVLVVLIILVGLAVLIIWLAVRPRRLVYSIESASVHNYNLSHDHLNATFDFELRAYNPNTKVSVYYDYIEATVSYDDETLAFNRVRPFHQPHRNVTLLGLNFVPRDNELFPGVSKKLRSEKASGEVELEVRVKAKIRFKVGVWKSNHYTMRLLCGPVMVHLSSARNFKRVFCDVDL